MANIFYINLYLTKHISKIRNVNSVVGIFHIHITWTQKHTDSEHKELSRVEFELTSLSAVESGVPITWTSTPSLPINHECIKWLSGEGTCPGAAAACAVRRAWRARARTRPAARPWARPRRPHSRGPPPTRGPASLPAATPKHTQPHYILFYILPENLLFIQSIFIINYGSSPHTEQQCLL